MDSDLRTFATGGGTGGEGIQIWDLRHLKDATTKINWGVSATGGIINKCYNTVKFVPGMSMVLAGCTDEIVPAKCFNFRTGCNVIQDFHQLKRSCFSIDVSKDAT